MQEPTYRDCFICGACRKKFDQQLRYCNDTTAWEDFCVTCWEACYQAFWDKVRQLGSSPDDAKPA